MENEIRNNLVFNVFHGFFLLNLQNLGSEPTVMKTYELYCPNNFIFVSLALRSIRAIT